MVPLLYAGQRVKEGERETRLKVRRRLHPPTASWLSQTGSVKKVKRQTAGTGRAETDAKDGRDTVCQGKKIVSVYPSKSVLLKSSGFASEVKKRPWQLRPVQCLLTERRLLFAAQAAH